MRPVLHGEVLPVPEPPHVVEQKKKKNDSFVT
jgi:hypothetical protein